MADEIDVRNRHHTHSLWPAAMPEAKAVNRGAHANPILVVTVWHWLLVLFRPDTFLDYSDGVRFRLDR